MKSYTIKEIAKLAGVSAGTVDRVLHQRGKVSKEKEDTVNKILKEIDYRPNQVARSLKLNRRYRLVVLFPDFELDEYWKPCFDGVHDQLEVMEERGILIDVLKYDPSDANDFNKACNESMALNPDCILLGALFFHESQTFLEQLEKKGIPFGLINTEIESANSVTFVGQDLIQSGRTAAHLFNAILPNVNSLLIIHVAEEFENASHMQQKEKGFRAFFDSSNEKVSIKTIHVKIADNESIAHQLQDINSSEIDGIFVTTSKAHVIADYTKNIPVIGYDLLLKNIDYLMSGKIKFLIYQNPKFQAFQSISFLSDYLSKNIQPPAQKLLPIEIISSENVHSYNF